jgi:hypothetical protein
METNNDALAALTAEVKALREELTVVRREREAQRPRQTMARADFERLGVRECHNFIINLKGGLSESTARAP